MKHIGINCNVDELGRVVIPKEIRDFFHMTDGVDKFEFFSEDGAIVLRKFNPTNLESGMGIPRTIDRQGRVVIPKGIRKTFNIVDDVDALDIYIEDARIILKKHDPGCVFCGKSCRSQFKKQFVCASCAKKLFEEFQK
ncbi:MAG: AbrB/MazE/SpoVT family DNA-binding domain-containing protein [Candidatus Howiella sp.]|jgi:transcriptional pleiotropic regulator of transition state genes